MDITKIFIKVLIEIINEVNNQVNVPFNNTGFAFSKISVFGSSERPNPSNTNIAKITVAKLDSIFTLCLARIENTCDSSVPTWT